MLIFHLKKKGTLCLEKKKENPFTASELPPTFSAKRRLWRRKDLEEEAEHPWGPLLMEGDIQTGDRKRVRCSEGL